MRTPMITFAAALGLAVLALAGVAAAGGCGCTPPPCCAPPTPPPPPHYPCCQPPGHTVNIPGITINVGATAIVNVNAQASASGAASAGASAGAGGSAGATVFYGGGGGGGGFATPGVAGFIQGLNVVGDATRRVSYESSRTVVRKVVIQAVCLDDKDVPHPASQTSPDRDIEDSFDGELYRCIAGARMQATIADYDGGEIRFDHGRVLACQKNEAIYHGPGGAVECRPQKPARDCNERSLLRRFGAGVKILTMRVEEKYTAFREETQTSVTSTASAISLDGGVGGFVY
jgi:hypothetical protein